MAFTSSLFKNIFLDKVLRPHSLHLVQDLNLYSPYPIGDSNYQARAIPVVDLIFIGYSVYGKYTYRLKPFIPVVTYISYLTYASYIL